MTRYKSAKRMRAVRKYARLSELLTLKELDSLVVAAATEHEDHSENDDPCAVVVKDVA